MGRFRQQRIIVKVCSEIDIVFMDWNRIYVKVKSSELWYLFQKYHAPLGTYTKKWRPFKRRLMKIKDPTFSQVCYIGAQYEIIAQGAVGTVDLGKKAIEIRYPTWSVKGVAA